MKSVSDFSANELRQVLAIKEQLQTLQGQLEALAGEDGPDIVVLKRMKSVNRLSAKLVQRKGRLVFIGQPITTEEVKSLLEDFP